MAGAWDAGVEPAAVGAGEADRAAPVAAQADREPGEQGAFEWDPVFFGAGKYHRTGEYIGYT